MEADTGAATSIISKSTYEELFSDLELKKPSVILHTYTGELIPLLGEITAVVPVPKPNGKIRLCGNYKLTVNPALEADQYLITKPEDLFTALTGGKKFSKLDLKEAYQQVVLEEESHKFVTINTHQICYTQVPFGILSAPSMFQKVMDTSFKGQKVLHL